VRLIQIFRQKGCSARQRTKRLHIALPPIKNSAVKFRLLWQSVPPYSTIFLQSHPGEQQNAEGFLSCYCVHGRK